MEAYLSEIRLFASDDLPENFLPCDGRTLSIRQYQALYACVGNAYGGDGNTTFGVPDLRNRVPIGGGESLGLGESGAIVVNAGGEVLGTRAMIWAIAIDGMFPTER